MDCNLINAGLSGSPFTWCNGWAPDRRVWERTNRVLTNYKWVNLFDSTNINFSSKQVLIIPLCSLRHPIIQGIISNILCS